MTLALLALLLLVLIVIGAPIAFAMIVIGTAGLLLQLGMGPTLGILQTSPYRSSASFLLTTIPMFILMAEFLAGSKMAQDMFRAGHYWLGHLRGGMAVATTLASALLAALLGSSPAAAATMSSIAVPEMRKYGYDDRLSLGIVASAGTLAVIIPPSVILILYGILTESSIGRLFVAGLVPGIMTATGYILLVNIWTRFEPSIAPVAEKKFTREEKIGSLKPIWPAILLIMVVLGGIYSGFVTPTEAGAVGAAGAFVIGILFSGLRWKGVTGALERASKTTAMIFAIIIAASIFGYYLTSTQVAQDTIRWVQASGMPATAVLIAVLLVYLVLGAFLDPVSILVLTLPLAFPLIMSLGYDSIWFGIIATKMVEIGLVTPPVGINVFVTAGAVGADLKDAFKGASLFILVDVVVVILLIAFPQIVTFLPDLMF